MLHVITNTKSKKVQRSLQIVEMKCRRIWPLSCVMDKKFYRHILATIGCNGLNSFYHPFYPDVMQGKIPDPLPLYCKPGQGLGMTHLRLLNIQYTGTPASLVHPHTMTKAIFFNVDSIPCVSLTQPVS